MSNLLSQLPVEVLVFSDAPIPVHLSQLPVEVLHSTTLEVSFMRLSQVAVEVLLASVTTTEVQLSQLPVEILLEAPLTPADDVAATQLATELAQQQGSSSDVTQAPLELAHQQLGSAIEATHALIEIGWKKAPGPARVTQLLIEIIRRPLGPDVPVPPDPPFPPSAPDCVDATTRLVNLALAHLGITDAVPNINTDYSRQAETARLHYRTEMDAVLRAHPWQFATRYAVLVLVAGTPEVPVSRDWTYSYRLPADCLAVRRIVPAGARQRTFDPTPVPFDTSEDTAGGLLTTHADPVEIEYTARIDCPARVRDPLFRRACSWRLAHAFAAPLARDTSHVVSAYQMYRQQILEAQARDQDEQQPQHPPFIGDAEWLRGRD